MHPMKRFDIQGSNRMYGFNSVVVYALRFIFQIHSIQMQILNILAFQFKIDDNQIESIHLIR